MPNIHSQSAPKAPLATYSLKSNADAFSALLTQLSIPSVILLAHDWGSMIAWRFYNYHPTQVTHIISLCVPYAPPHPQAPYLPLEKVVKKLPNFTYQIGLADPQTEVDLWEKDNIRKFLKAIYRGIGDGRGEKGGSINVERDMIKSVGDMPRGWVLSEEELEWYVEEFYRVGMHGPLAYYKTRKENYEDEKRRFPGCGVATSDGSGTREVYTKSNIEATGMQSLDGMGSYRRD
ncbi:hypothetical protein ABW19_dt0202240 [Dactylella cylindrospora]|nr:hypothetical protein ABW19_dt0202240 [Dactylella cylindrospora]